MTLPNLISLLTAAEEGSQEFDVRIWALIGYDSPTTRGPERPMGDSANLADAMATYPGDFHGFVFCWDIPRLTTSLDAALALVSEKLGPLTPWFVSREGDNCYAASVTMTPRTVKAWTAPLALLCALLTALAAEDQA